MYQNVGGAAVGGASLGAVAGADSVLAFTGIAVGVYLAVAAALVVAGFLFRLIGTRRGES